MVTIKPFQALRPAKKYVEQIAALPYDVYSREEAKEKVKDNKLSFLNIDRPETQFDSSFNMYSDEVYEMADKQLKSMETEGYFIQDEKPCYYVYELTMDGRSQTGLAACSSVDDYIEGVVKKHENTRVEKEKDRIRHVDTTSAQTGPIFLTYRGRDAIRDIINNAKNASPVYDFVSDDEVSHKIWVINDETVIGKLTGEFLDVETTYIADGHHRAASAVKVSKMRRSAHPGYDGDEEFNFFLSVLFDKDELKILDYNRVVLDNNGKSNTEIMKMIKSASEIISESSTPIKPQVKGEFGFYFNNKWHLLKEINDKRITTDPVSAMDVSYLQREILEPVFGIGNPATDNRIDFVGGIRGLGELERRVKEGAVCAFSMYPSSIDELFDVADAGLLMPPKSTWFEPKLRSGLLIHKIER
ncbi:MAG: DUF1015 domain-containing protein [Suipraeoptans sp.]